MSGVELLLSAGHLLSDIKRYSFRVLQLLVDQVERRRNGEMADYAIAIRMAQNGDGKQFDGFLQRLRPEE